MSRTGSPESPVELAAAGEPLGPVSHAAAVFVPPDVARFTQTADPIMSAELGRAVAETLGPERPVPRNHALVTVGRDVPDAVVRAVLLGTRAATCRTLVRRVESAGT